VLSAPCLKNSQNTTGIIYNSHKSYRIITEMFSVLCAFTTAPVSDQGQTDLGEPRSKNQVDGYTRKMIHCVVISLLYAGSDSGPV
jgi:hypothetical protein